MKKTISLLFGVLMCAGIVLGLSSDWRWALRYWMYRTPSEDQVGAISKCSRCNVILVSLDTLRWDVLQSSMPKAAEILRESVFFKNAFAPAFYTTPSHMSVMTALDPPRHRVIGAGIRLPRWGRSADEAESLSTQFQTWAEFLKTEGYHTFWRAPTSLKHLSPQLGFHRGFTSIGESLFDRKAEKLNVAAENRLLSSTPKFFAFLHSYTAHAPYELKGRLQPEVLSKKVTARHRSEAEKWSLDQLLHRVGQAQLELLESLHLSQTEVEDLRQAYIASARRLDEQLGLFWTEFKKSPRAQDTVVVFFADHGEEFFEHGHGGHSSFHHHTAHVPVFVYVPGQMGRIRSDLMSLVDILPTTLDILDLPPLAQAQGVSLREGAKREYVYGAAMGTDFVFDGSWKLMRDEAGRDLLFYLPLDPMESNDLSSSFWPFVKATHARLGRERRAWWVRQKITNSGS